MPGNSFPGGSRSTNVICTDKTGTLTKNEMTVLGYKPEGDILDEEGNSLSDEKVDELEIMFDAATMASNAEIHESDENHPNWYPIGDPTEAAELVLLDDSYPTLVHAIRKGRTIYNNLKNCFLTVVYVPGLNSYLGFAGITAGDWLRIFAGAAVFLFGHEVIKWMKRQS